MRTVYSPNPSPIPSPDDEIEIDVPEVEEVAFTLVTNKKGKEKTKASSPPATNSRNKIPLVSRAPPILKTTTASAASKLATTTFFFFLHQFITRCSITVHGRLFTTSSLQFWPQETKTPLIGRETQLESIEIKEKSK